MSPLEAVAVVAAGAGAGAINAVIGSGSLITFPVLLAVGYSPITANVSNNIGMVPGSLSAIHGLRAELEGQRRRARTLAVSSVAGALTGAVLLLVLPSSVFDAVVPVLVLASVGLMLVQPRLSRWVASRRAPEAPDVGLPARLIVFAAGIYGGYFGAAQGIILLTTLAVFVPDDLRRSNALKNVLAMAVNATAAVVFILFADVAWEAVALVAIGSVVGGALGAQVARRIPQAVLRGLVVVIGTYVAFRLLLT